MHFAKCLLQDIKLHVVNHGILPKLSSLIHLYSSFLLFPNNKLGHTLVKKVYFIVFVIYSLF